MVPSGTILLFMVVKSSLANYDDSTGRPYRIRICYGFNRNIQKVYPRAWKEVIPDTFLLAI
jgi:hypothetical protein